MQQKLQTISSLYNSAYAQTKQQYGFARGHFFTVDNNNKVEEWKMVSETIFDNSWIICCTYTEYQDYGLKGNYLKFAIIDKQGEPVNKIILSKWTMSKINFSATKYEEPVPEITVHLNNNPDEVLILTFYKGKTFQNVWNYFLRIDQECNTISEAKFFHQYFENLYTCVNKDKALEKYKLEIEQKNNVINQYQDLLKKIDERFNSN